MSQASRTCYLLPSFVLLAVVAAFSSGCSSSRWYRGNIHTHSLWSDGNDFPEMIVAWYAENGYDFLALSDHNVLSRGEMWMELAEIEKRGGADALAKYRARFGDDWVETRGRGESLEVRLRPLDEFRGLLEEAGVFILIEGEEITDLVEELPVHLNATNLAELIEPQGGTSVRDAMRRNLAAVEEQSERLERPILAHLNHPNFYYAVTAEDLAAVTNERFFEVYNGHPGVDHRGDDLHAGVERIWDIANTLRIVEEDAPPLLGLATDDAHDYHDFADQEGALPGRGWIMVRAKSLDPESLIEAIEAGEFYASSGVTLRDVRFSHGTLTVEIDARAGVEYTTRFIGTLAGADVGGTPVLDADGNEVIPATRRYSPEVGAVLATVRGPVATYRLQGNELYVRAMVESTVPVARPVWDGQLQRAWTQPVGWRASSLR